jgi:hypothetical protein
MALEILFSHRLVFIAILISSAPSFAKTEKAEDKEKQVATSALVSELKKQGFFRAATCREIADAFLKDAGLPALNENKKPNGRGAFDRSKAKQELPIFFDEITTAGNDPVKSRFQSKEAPSETTKVWLFEIHRSFKVATQPRRLRTQYAFRVQTERTPYLCETSKVFFALDEGDETKEPILTLNEFAPINCLNLALLNEQPNSSKKADLPSQALGWMKKDCTVALNYSREDQLKSSP